VAVAIGGSIGGLTAAIKLAEIYDTVYCCTGFNNYKESGNNGESRGLRTFNLEEELMDIVITGWEYWESIGLRCDLIHEAIIHRSAENVEYKITEKHNKLLEILDRISPKFRKRESKQLNENTVLEDTGIYRIQEIVVELKKIAHARGVVITPVHLNILKHTDDCIYLNLQDSDDYIYELDCDRCVISIGNEIKNIETNMEITKPIAVWNEFTYFTIHTLYSHDGIWTWGTENYNTKEVYKDRLGFYVMMENPEILKVACDTSFVNNKWEMSIENLNEYRKQKSNFVKKHLGLKYSDYRHIECYYSVAPYVQHSGPVSVINAGGYGYCVPGFVINAIEGKKVPKNENYERHLFSNKRHDLSIIK
jgi:hypothetical protein